MTIAEPDDPEIPGLTAAARDHLRRELGPDGDRAIRCLTTANALLLEGHARSHLRFAESAIYNLREAFDSVVGGSDPVGDVSDEVREAWKRLKAGDALPPEEQANRALELAEALDAMNRGRRAEQQAARRLRALVESRTGLPATDGPDAPIRIYQDLRSRAAGQLHGSATVAEAEELFSLAVDWFDRFFTPPSLRYLRLSELAAAEYTPSLVVEFRRLAQTSLNAGEFLAQVRDPAWLPALRDLNFISFPRTGEPWPVDRLVGGALADEHVAALLLELFDQSQADRADAALEDARAIAHTAFRLGAASSGVMTRIVRRYPHDGSIQQVAVYTALSLSPYHPDLESITDSLVGNLQHQREYHVAELVDRIIEGLTAENARPRLRLLALKAKAALGGRFGRYRTFDLPRLDRLEPDPYEVETILVHRIATALPRLRALGVTTTEVLAYIETIPGEGGTRLVSHAMIDAADIGRAEKIAHLVNRASAEVVSADDRDLLATLLPLTSDEVAVLRGAFGGPEPPPGDDTFGSNWARAWRWSAILPGGVLEGWNHALNAVAEIHGWPDPASLDRHISGWGFSSGRSPLQVEELRGLLVGEAAARIAAWRPAPETGQSASARDLARTLEALVAEAPRAWTADPAAVVSALREPVYVDHYLRALRVAANEVTDQAVPIIDAVLEALNLRLPATTLGSNDFEYEAEWSFVEAALVELIDALADADAPLDPRRQEAWQWAVALSREVLTANTEDDPERYDEDPIERPLQHAVNTRYGTGLQAVLALGAWEYRNHGQTAPEMLTELDVVLTVPGSRGLEVRALVASARALLETIASEWLTASQDTLYDGPLGDGTFDQTLKWSRPTSTFLASGRSRLIEAARRGADNAVTWLLIGNLWGQPAYEIDQILKDLATTPAALNEIGAEAARLTGGLDAGSAMVERGIAIWHAMVDALPALPAGALRGLGRWSRITTIPDETWLALLHPTVRLTKGDIEDPADAVQRVATIDPINDAELALVTKLLGQGEYWEQHLVNQAALEVLRSVADRPRSDDFRRLQERLVERGVAAAVEL